MPDLKALQRPYVEAKEGGVAQACVICLKDFISEAPVVVLGCGHYFHLDCLE